MYLRRGITRAVSRPRVRAALLATVVALAFLPALGSADEAPPDGTPRLVGELKRFPSNLQQILGESSPLDAGLTSGNGLLGGIPLVDPVARRIKLGRPDSANRGVARSGARATGRSDRRAASGVRG